MSDLPISQNLDSIQINMNMQNDVTNAFQSPDPQLPPYGYALQTPGRQLDQQSTTPPSIPRQSTKKRKLDSFGDTALDYGGDDDHD